MTASAMPATRSAAGLSCGRAAASAATLGANSPGSFTSSPRRSFNCEKKIDTAMPAVNPVTTG